jgi:hypothetical protein
LQSLAQGTTNVTATFSSVTSNAAAVTVSAPALDRIDVTPLGVRLPIGLVQQYQATGLYSDGSVADVSSTVSWSSSVGTVASVSSTGRATGLAAGTTNVTATQAGVTGVAALVVTSVSVTSIAVTPSTVTLPVGVKVHLVATALLSDGSARDITSDVAWTSGSTAATVTNAQPLPGLVTAAAAGTATITATLGARSGSATVTVITASLNTIQVFPADETVPRGLSLNYGAVGLYSDGNAYDLTLTATWSSSAPTVATVSDALPTQGLVTTLAAGSTQIRATLGAITGATSLTVNTATLSSLSVTPALATMPIGAPRQYRATGVFSDGSSRDVTTLARWETGNLAVAAISNAAGSDGLLTSLGAGTTTVTATMGTVVGTARVTVTNAALERITVSPPIARIGLQAIVPFTATAIFSDGSSFDLTHLAAWTSSSATVASVRNDAGFHGVTTGLAAGTATITATWLGNTGTATLTVTNATLLDLYISPAVVRTGVGIDVQFSASGLWTDGTTSDLTRVATWSSSLSSVAVISNAIGSQGLATTRGVGTSTIGAAYGGRTDSTTLTATNATLSSIAVTPATRTLGLGGQQQYRAVATFSDGTTFDITAVASWSSTSPLVASVSGAPGSVGLATALSGGTTTLRAQVGAVSGTASLTVSGAALTSVTVTPATGIIPRLYWRQYRATATYADGTSQDVTEQAAWSTGTPAVASAGNGMLSGGRVSGLTVGTSTVTARFGGLTGNAAATVSQMTLTGLVVTPDDAFTPVGVPIQLTATGTFSDGVTTLTLDITLQVGWKVAPKKNGTVSNTDGSRGLVTMYEPSSSANILAQAFEPATGTIFTSNTKVNAP